MAKKVEWTESAWRDLEEIANYIAKDSSIYAASFVEGVKDLARSLRRFEERGRVVPEYDDPNIRELFIKSYRMLYHTADDTVYVICIIHGARDLSMNIDIEERIP
ncbi:MAG: type II toxin-antitoxin system RelE/ParE family toxin [bacterium]